MKVNKEELKKIIADVLEIEPEELDDDADFNKDLAANSLQILDMINELEDTYELTIDPQKVREMSTVNKIIAALEQI
jgi:acyl carrier protein